MSNLMEKSILVLVLFVMILNLGSCTSSDNVTDKTDAVYATVIEIEKYGHAVLDITTSDFTDIGYRLGDIVRVRFDSHEKDMPFF